MPHDWFWKLTGFREESYELTRSRLVVEGDELVSTVNGKRYGIGALEVPTVAELRSRVEVPHAERSSVRCMTGEARAMHADPELEGALFQVASQFNLLEMTGPSVIPEDGVTRYSSDHTQGPACAVAAGAARDQLRGELAIGLHRHVQVTDVLDGPRRHVSQAFCSALPVAYSSVRPSVWEAFARLILEATYEATLLAAVEQSAAGGSNIVLLTRVGGGVFGNDDKWIDDAITRAIGIVEHAGLDIRLVSHGRIHESNRAIAERFEG
jgi:hypothetical protein